MAIDHTAQVVDGVLVVTAAGFDESAEQVRDYGLWIIQECRRTGVVHVLCDERQLQYRLSTIDTYAIATFIAAEAPRVARTAIVCGAQCLQDALFWEDVAVNRGLMVKVFRELEPARAWLQRQKAGPHGRPSEPGAKPAPQG